MAKNRIVNTKFWTDLYILDQLNAVEKLVFLYLLTNPYTDISGIYELPMRMMAIETGLDRENLEKVIIPKLQKDGKIMYINGWIAIKNFQKHQSLNPSVKKGIEEGMLKAPEKLRKFIGSDSLYTDSDSLSHLNSNLIKLNTNTNGANRFAPPSLEEVSNYCRERKNSVKAQAFLDFYSAKGWMMGKNKMKDWKAAVRTWENRDGNSVDKIDEKKEKEWKSYRENFYKQNGYYPTRK